jgi:hypothetical protein
MPGMSGSGGPSMLLFRIVLLGTLAAVSAWSAIRTLRMGRFHARGGSLITGNRNPASFWTSVIVQLLFIGVLLAFMWSLLARSFTA